MITTTLNKENVNNASGNLFTNDKDFFSFFISEVNGESFEKRYTKECSRSKNGKEEFFTKTVIPKTEKTAMLFKIKQYLEFTKDNRCYFVERVLKNVA